MRAKPVRLMTFNVRFDTILDEPGGNRWKDRVHSAIETVRRYSPHVVGFQEALASQLADLVRGLPEYASVGKPRETGEVGEHVPIFFDARRFDREASGDFWLSSTPETEGSMGWDAHNARHCTWIILRERETGWRFAVFNTHLDRWGVEARIEAARLIVARAALAQGLCYVAMGDFNAYEDSEPLAILRAAGLRDTFRELHPDAQDVQTVHHYRQLSGSEKIDFILCDWGWRVLAAEIVREPAVGRLPSDHFPVVAELAPLPPNDLIAKK